MNLMEESQVNQPAAVSAPESNIPQKLLGPKELLNQSFQIYKSRAKILFLIFAIPSLISLLINGIGTVLSVLSFAALFGKVLTPTSEQGGLLGPSVFLVILFALFVVFYVIANAVLSSWGQTSLYYAIKDREKEIGVKEAFKRGWKKVFSYWWIMTLSTLAFVFGLLLFIIPGIIFATWYSLAPIVLISEDLRGLKALNKSKEYISGRFAAVWGRLLFIMFILATIYFVPTTLLGLFEEISYIKIISGIYSLIAPTLLVPFYLVYQYQLYLNLRSLKGEPQPAVTKVGGLAQNPQQ